MNESQTRRKPIHHESKMQRAIIQWVRLHEHIYPELKVLYSIPNGGKRGVITASILKAEGALAGVPDLHLAVPRGGFASLYIELKNGKNKLSPAQSAIHVLLAAQGNRVEVCRSWEEATELLVNYLKS